MTYIENNTNFIKSTEIYLYLFIIFSIIPLIKIAGISITFPLFLMIAVTFLKHKKKLFKITQWTDIFLILFLIFVFISWILQEDTYKDRTLLSIVKLMIQYSYWVVVALFIKTWIYQYDFYKLSRTFFYATVASIIYYITLNHIYLVFYPNVLAYTVVATVPIGYYYVMKRFSIFVASLISLGVIFGVMLSGSRTGTILSILEMILIFSLGSVRLKKISLVGIVFAIPMSIVMYMSLDQTSIQEGKYVLADMIEDYSPKIAHTLRMEENVLERDKSLLIRKLMIQKGEKIFEEHPLFGVGPGNFARYYVELDIVGISHWLHGTEEKYNMRSSQNSYLMILAENGIFALSCLLIVFFLILKKGFNYIKTFENNAEVYVYIPFLTLLFYGVILVTTMGTLFWLILGLALTVTDRQRKLS
jgi:O-antigen ligase